MEEEILKIFYLKGFSIHKDILWAPLRIVFTIIKIINTLDFISDDH
jgi:ABC-type iron transport system FetAB permease component